jgi:NDP-sugar pyrophosphorylase family protein
VAHERPRQAVILAGGRGTRLGPLTQRLPKPMVPVGDRPFLEHVVELLRDEGFDRLLLLLGYLPDAIRDHFGDGTGMGVRIDYSVTDPDRETSHRMRAAAAQLDPRFLLVYGDNYWPMSFAPMWERYTADEARAMITVYANRDGFARDSVRVGPDGRVEVFDRSRTTPGLAGVEISYAILERSVLDLLPEHDEPFEQAVYPRLVERGELHAFVTERRYYDVGTPELLADAQQLAAAT